MRYLAVVDTETNEIYVEYNGCIIKYDLAMYSAALLNPKYWEDAEIETLNDERKIPDIILENL